MQSRKYHYFKILISVCGLLGLLLRMALAAGIDGKGLLPSGHPAWIGLWILTAVTALILLTGTRRIQGPESYQEAFPCSAFSAAGCALVAIPPLLTAVDHWQTGPAGRDPLSIATFVLYGAIAVLTGVGMILTAVCRLTEKQPPFLSHVALCVFLALKCLTLYQTWSFDPQLHDYCFQLLACIALTMTAYQMAVFEVGRGSHRTLWFWALSATYLCFMCLDSGLLYAAGAIWTLTNLTSLRIRRERKHPEADAQAE